jgi:hypothetical protein
MPAEKDVHEDSKKNEKLPSTSPEDLKHPL